MKLALLIPIFIFSCSSVSGPNADKFKGGFYPEELEKRLVWHVKCKSIKKVEADFQELGLLGQILDGYYKVTCDDNSIKTCSMKAKLFSPYLSIQCK